MPYDWACEGPRFRIGTDMTEDTSSSENLAVSSARAHRLLEEAEQSLNAGDAAKAQDVCREILAEHTDYVGALDTLGQAYMAANNHDSALPCFIRAAMLSPEEPAILAALADVYCELRADEAALDAARESLEHSPDEETGARAHLVCGRVFERASDYARASEHLEQALALKPDLSAAALLLGACHMEQGEQDGVATAYAAALKSGVSLMDHAQILYDLANRPNASEAEKLLSRIDAVKNEADGFETPMQDAIFKGRLNLARARLLEVLGQHEEGWQALEIGNAPLHDAYSAAYSGLQRQSAPTIERARGWTYSGPADALGGKDIPVTLIILGASRSGKSTLERLVGSMAGVTVGFESELVQTSVAYVSNSAGLLSLQLPGKMPATFHGEFSKTYVSELNQRASGAKLFTMTHPGLIPDLGRIAELVPNVRIVFVERNKDDAAHRIFGKMYPQDTNPFAYAVANIDEHLDGYARLIEAWRGHLDKISMRITYEDMVADPKGTLAKIAKLCGLPAPKGKLPEIGDDRGCAEPYLGFLNKARGVRAEVDAIPAIGREKWT